MNEEPEIKLDDLTQLDDTASLVSLHQEGNFLVGLTDKGVRFRQHIPQGKILNKNKEGNWVLQQLEVM